MRALGELSLGAVEDGEEGIEEADDGLGVGALRSEGGGGGGGVGARGVLLRMEVGAERLLELVHVAATGWQFNKIKKCLRVQLKRISV